MYKRILLKLSGEQLQGQYNGGGFDIDRAKWIADELRDAINRGTEIVIMVGGGNYARGSQLASSAIPRVVADNIGMLATVMNTLALVSVFNSEGIPSVALSNIKADQVIDQFTHRRAISHLEKGRVVVVAGGIGRPYLTTDTAAVSLALEMDCDVVLKATKVDGVFSDDPFSNRDAKKYDSISYNDVLSKKEIGVMDNAALGLASEHKMPIIIFALLEKGNIAKAITGNAIGTIIQ